MCKCFESKHKTKNHQTKKTCVQNTSLHQNKSLKVLLILKSLILSINKVLLSSHWQSGLTEQP